MAAKRTHSSNNSEKVCKDFSGKEVLLPVVLTWAPLSTQACAHIKTHPLVHLQRTVSAGV